MLTLRCAASEPAHAGLMFFPTMSCRQVTTDGPGRYQVLESLQQRDPRINESEIFAPRPYCDVQ